jgi:hypothetical protein
MDGEREHVPRAGDRGVAKGLVAGGLVQRREERRDPRRDRFGCEPDGCKI